VLQLVIHHRDVDTWRDTQGPDSASSNFWAGCLFCDIAKVAIISREDLAKSGCEINMNFLLKKLTSFYILDYPTLNHVSEIWRFFPNLWLFIIFIIFYFSSFNFSISLFGYTYSQLKKRGAKLLFWRNCRWQSLTTYTSHYLLSH
jgi:hypothetical protein